MGCAAAPLFMKGWRSSPLGGVACWHRCRRSSTAAAATYVLFLCQTTSRSIPTPNILCRSSGSEHKDGSSLKSSCGTEDASRGGFFIFIYHPKWEKGSSGVGGARGIPSQSRKTTGLRKKRKKEKHLCIIDVLICANAQVFVK